MTEGSDIRWAIFDGRGERYGSYRWRWVATIRRLMLEPTSPVHAHLEHVEVSSDQPQTAAYKAMSISEAEALMDTFVEEMWPQFRKALYGVAVIAGLMGAAGALVLLTIVAAAR